MRRLASIAALGITLAVTGCLDSTSPTTLVDGRVAHALPGAGPAVVAIDLTPTFQLQPLDFTYFVVAAGPRTYDFQVANQNLTVQAQHDRDITAIILLDVDGPVLRPYYLDRGEPEQRLAVINAYGAAGDLEIEIDGGDISFTRTVSPGESAVIEPLTGAYSVRVRGPEDDQSHAVEGFSLETGDHGFLVIIPGPGPQEPYRMMLF